MEQFHDRASDRLLHISMSGTMAIALQNCSILQRQRARPGMLRGKNVPAKQPAVVTKGGKAERERVGSVLTDKAVGNAGALQLAVAILV